MSTDNTYDSSAKILGQILQEASGFDIQELDWRATFLELGFDSLFLIQFSQKLKSKLKIKITFRQLIEEIPTIESLVQFVSNNLPSDLSAESRVGPRESTDIVAPEDTKTPLSTSDTSGGILQADASVLQGQVEKVASCDLGRNVVTSADSGARGQPAIVGSIATPAATSNREALAQIILQQNQLMALQLELLSGQPVAADSLGVPSRLENSPSTGSTNSTEPVSAQVVDKPQAASRSGQVADGQAQDSVPKGEQSSADMKRPSKRSFERFGPYKPVRLSSTGGLTDQQQLSLNNLIQRFTAKTSQSRALAGRHRAHFADPRGVAGYRRIWKSMVYQISVVRSQGSKLWDVDGNEYIDIAMGFGLNLFGQSPGFVTEALHKQLDLGVEVGPQSALAGEVAQLLCDFSRKERATFCNTGSEAVMAAMRLARTVTGKEKVVFFNKDYHGNFEEVLLRSSPMSGSGLAAPAAPGIPQSFADSAIVLDYGTPQSLQVIAEHAADIAAVLVEPVQSADPFNQPREYLHALRKLTCEHDIALIMDEVISGFRAAPGGAQELFDVWGDMATYGKVLGGGMPIGALAGSAKYMDALDGGNWSFDGDSEPEADMTFFAGTFVRHPLALVAAHQVMMKIKEEGPELQRQLTDRTAKLASELNRYFTENLFPIRVAQFTSLFRFMFPADLEYADLLYFHLLDRGIFTRGWADNCFLSTAHTDEDVQRIIDAVIDSCNEIRAGGFMPRPEASLIANKVMDASGNTGVSMVEGADSEADRPGQSFPLTETQQEILLTSQISPAASYANNEPFIVRLEGELRQAELVRAIQEVLKRHAALHVKIDPVRSLQEYVEPQDFNIVLRDLSTLGDQSSELARITRRFAETPFDVLNEPLVRVELLKLSDREHVLFFDGHHIVTDGWSWNVMLSEMGRLYSSFCTGAPAVLEPAGSFRDYVLGNPDREAAADEALEYWKSKYSELPEPLELPTDRVRGKVQKYDAGSVIVDFKPATFEAMKKTAAKAGCSLFTVGLTAYKILLSKLSGQQDIVVGMRAAGQTLAENPNLVGLCMNVLPMRTLVEDKQSIAQMLKIVQSDLLQAFEQQDCTLGKIVRALPVKRVQGRMPLTDVHFNLDKDATDIHFHDLATTVEMTEKRGINHDLFFNLNETSTGLKAYVDFRSDLYNASTIHRWLEHFETMVLAIAEDLDQRIGSIPILSPLQRNEILVKWNQTEASYPQLTAAQLFEFQANEAPERIAISYGQKRLTYAELNADVNRLANYLIGLGIQAGTHVGVLLERSEQMVVATLALMKIGASYVPMDPEFPDDRLVWMADDAQLRFVVTESHLEERGVAPDTLSICLDILGDEISQQESCSPDCQVDMQSVAYVIFTSGSTGKPKGVCITHRALTNFLCSMAKQPGFGKEDRLASVTTLSFDIAGLELYLPLIQGGQLLVVDSRDASDGKKLADFLDSHQVTVLQATPATFRLMLESGWRGKQDLRVLCGGEAFPYDLASDLISRCQEVWNMYGPTETTIWSTIKRMTTSELPISIGRPIDNTTIFILDQYDAPVPVGVVGRLCIGGDGLAAGYLNRPELTAERFIEVNKLQPGGPIRLYDTGDQARWLASGELQFLGRKDDQVKISGYRIELGEIEAVLSQHPSVEQAVVSVFDRDHRPRLVAFVKPNSRATSYAEVRDYLKERLPSYMLPAAIEFLETIPLTPNGKVDRKRLPEPKLDRPELETEFAEPRNRIEQDLASIFMDLIPCDRVGVFDNFFELGGHSLTATRVVARLSGKYASEISVADIFESPMISELARKLSGADSITADEGIGRASRELRDLSSI